MKNKEQPKVSIVCTTYNQEAYLKEALDSFLMQETNFHFEVIVGEDCSTDNTKAILQEYAEKYPEIIKPIYQEKNTGGYKNFIDTLNACNGEYFVINEGDDYFTDKYKLQTQADFLDEHPDYSMCFHRVKVFFQDKSKKDYIFPSLKKIFKYGKKFGYNTLKLYNYIQTNSCMFRKYNKNFSEVLPTNVMPGDWFINIYYSKLGQVGFINKVMSAYRKHQNGVWYLISVSKEMKKHYLVYGISMVNFYYQASKFFCDDKEFWIKNANIMFNNVALAFLQMRAWDKLNDLKEYFPDLAQNTEGFWECDAFKKKYSKYKTLSNRLIFLVIFLIVLMISFITRSILL